MAPNHTLERKQKKHCRWEWSCQYQATNAKNNVVHNPILKKSYKSRDKKKKGALHAQRSLVLFPQKLLIMLRRFSLRQRMGLKKSWGSCWMVRVWKTANVMHAWLREEWLVEGGAKSTGLVWRPLLSVVTLRTYIEWVALTILVCGCWVLVRMTSAIPMVWSLPARWSWVWWRHICGSDSVGETKLNTDGQALNTAVQQFSASSHFSIFHLLPKPRSSRDVRLPNWDDWSLYHLGIYYKISLPSNKI